MIVVFPDHTHLLFLNLKAMTDEKKKREIKKEQIITKEQQHKHTITQLGAKDSISNNIVAEVLLYHLLQRKC